MKKKYPFLISVLVVGFSCFSLFPVFQPSDSEAAWGSPVVFLGSDTKPYEPNSSYKTITENGKSYEFVDYATAWNIQQWWHSSGGYWMVGEDGATQIPDADMNTLAGGSVMTAAQVNVDLTAVRDLPSGITQSDISSGKVIMKFTGGAGYKAGGQQGDLDQTSVFQNASSGGVRYQVSGNEITFKFKPIFNVNGGPFYSHPLLTKKFPSAVTHYGVEVFSIWSKGGEHLGMSNSDKYDNPNIPYPITPLSFDTANGYKGILKNGVNLSYYDADEIGHNTTGQYAGIGYGTFQNGGAVGLSYTFPIRIYFYREMGKNFDPKYIHYSPASPTQCVDTDVSVAVKATGFPGNTSVDTKMAFRVKRPDGSLYQPEQVQNISVPPFDSAIHTPEENNLPRFYGFTIQQPHENITLKLEFQVNPNGNMPSGEYTGDNIESRYADFFCGSILPKFVNYEKTSFVTSRPVGIQNMTTKGEAHWTFSYNKNAQTQRLKDNVFFDLTAGHGDKYFGEDLPTGVKKTVLKDWTWKIDYTKEKTVVFKNTSDNPIYLREMQDNGSWSSIFTVGAGANKTLTNLKKYQVESPLVQNNWWTTHGTDKWNEAVKPYQATMDYPSEYQCQIESIILSNNLFRFITIPTNPADASSNDRSNWDDGTFKGKLYPMSNFPDDSDSVYYGGFIFHKDFGDSPCMKWVAVPTNPVDVATNHSDDYDDGTYEGKLYPFANFPDQSDSVYYAGIVWKKGFTAYDVKWVTVPTNADDLVTNNRSHYDKDGFVGELYPLSNFPDDSGAVYYGGLVFRKDTVKDGIYDYKFVTRPTNPMDVADNGSDYWDDGTYWGQLYPLSNFPDNSDSVYYGGIVAYKNNY